MTSALIWSNKTRNRLKAAILNSRPDGFQFENWAHLKESTRTLSGERLAPFLSAKDDALLHWACYPYVKGLVLNSEWIEHGSKGFNKETQETYNFQLENPGESGASVLAPAAASGDHPRGPPGPGGAPPAAAAAGETAGPGRPFNLLAPLAPAAAGSGPFARWGVGGASPNPAANRRQTAVAPNTHSAGSSKQGTPSVSPGVAGSQRQPVDTAKGFRAGLLSVIRGGDSTVSSALLAQSPTPAAPVAQDVSQDELNKQFKLEATNGSGVMGPETDRETAAVDAMEAAFMTGAGTGGGGSTGGQGASGVAGKFPPRRLHANELGDRDLLIDAFSSVVKMAHAVTDTDAGLLMKCRAKIDVIQYMTRKYGRNVPDTLVELALTGST
jgi:hypothetical protein